MLHRFDRRADRPERRHQNDGRRRMKRLGGAQHVEAVGAAHLQVAHDDIEIRFVKLLDRGVAIAGLFDLVPSGRQCERESAAQRLVIFSYQNTSHISAFGSRLSAPRSQRSSSHFR
jgi:hypothetical protein